MEWFEYVLILLAGLLSGGINTLAGSGSLITLPLLIFLGLPADVANGTNRVGVLLQTAVAVPTMQSRAKFDLRGAWWIFLAGAVGAVIGAWLAVSLDAAAMKQVIGYLLIIMLPVIVIKPKRWLHEGLLKPETKRNPLYWLLFVIIGIYGGFIQAGIGIFLLVSLVLGVGYNLIHANAVKMVFVLICTLAVLPIFISKGLINWEYGLLLSVGQVIGAWAAARFATGHPNAPEWIRRLLILVVVGSIVKFFWPVIVG